MKRKFSLLFVLLISVLFGCGGARVAKEIATASLDERTDVYHEAGQNEKPSPDLVDLVIKAQLKTNLKGFYILESKDSLHGNPTYPIVINIDGQHAVWQMEGHKEITSLYENGKRAPENGPGMRYLLEKRIRIAPGVHKVFVGLTGDDFDKQFEIHLVQGELNVLELKPIYLKNNHRVQTYLEGIKDFEIILSHKRAGENNNVVVGQDILRMGRLRLSGIRAAKRSDDVHV